MRSEENIANIIKEFSALKKLAEGAMRQVSDEQFFRPLDSETNSVAVIVKHMAGNMRSRWREFLTTDGEKPDRHRDSEFEIHKEDTRETLMRSWEGGFEILFGVLNSLKPDDLDRTVFIRTKPHTVYAAIHRQLTHYSYHTGQIVMLARHLTGDNWQTLSVAKGQSEQFNAKMRNSE
jgi:uncharacterized damage-inducible protein DinB